MDTIKRDHQVNELWLPEIDASFPLDAFAVIEYVDGTTAKVDDVESFGAALTRAYQSRAYVKHITVNSGDSLLVYSAHSLLKLLHEHTDSTIDN